MIAEVEDVVRVAREPARAAEGRPGPRRILVPAGITRVVDASPPYREASWASRGGPTVVEPPGGTRIGGRESW